MKFRLTVCLTALAWFLASSANAQNSAVAALAQSSEAGSSSRTTALSEMPNASATKTTESFSPEKLLSMLLHTKTGADKSSIEAALGVSLELKQETEPTGVTPEIESFNFHDSSGYIDFWDNYISGGHDFNIFIFLYNPPTTTCLTLSQVATAFQRAGMVPFSSSTGYDHHGISYNSNNIDHTADSDGGTVNDIPVDGNLIEIPSWSTSCVKHIWIGSRS